MAHAIGIRREWSAELMKIGIITIVVDETVSGGGGRREEQKRHTHAHTGKRVSTT